MEKHLQDELKAKSELEKEIEELEKELESLDSTLGPITTIQFQEYAISRVAPAIEKYIRLYSPTYNRDESLEYPLYSSKKAFKANKIFNILYLKQAIQDNIPLAHLESIAEDLKHHKENIFTDEFCNDIKKEIPKLLQIAN